MTQRALFWKYEPALFVAFIVLSLSPLFVCTYFPTLDGPAHLHNGNLLRHLWFEGNQTCLSFFDINSRLNSNMLDHIWFAIAGLFLPSNLVEKSLLLFYIVAFPTAYRFFIKQITEDQHSAKLASYLIFPFIYSFVFRIGFFNFCVGIPFVFWALGVWFKHRNANTPSRIVLLTVLVTLSYISHLLNFLFIGIVLLSIELQAVIAARSLLVALKKLKVLLIVFAPGLLLLLLFLIMNSGFEHEAARYLPFGRLLQTLIDLSPIITLSYDREVLFAHIILGALLVLLLMAGFQFLKGSKKQQSVGNNWLVPLVVVLVLFFLFPDWVASGGFISVRWATYFFLLLITLIAAKGLSSKLLVGPVILVLITHLFFMRYHTEETKRLDTDAVDLATAGRKMEENKVLLPLNYSANWMQINHGCYLATEKNVICLDNYEACKPHFPLIWKAGQEVYKLMPRYGNHFPPCIDIDAYEQQTHHRIDYLSRFCFNGDLGEACNAAVEKEIHEKFELVFQSENKKLELYKRKTLVE